jgi:hypothetical protein
MVMKSPLELRKCLLVRQIFHCGRACPCKVVELEKRAPRDGTFPPLTCGTGEFPKRFSASRNDFFLLPHPTQDAAPIATIVTANPALQLQTLRRVIAPKGKGDDRLQYKD